MRIGILGGGQLARMLALAGYPLGLEFSVLEPAADACALPLTRPVRSAYDDPAGLTQLAEACDRVTYEFENVPADAVAWLEQRVEVRPSPAALAVARDRLHEKRLFQEQGIGTAPFAPVDGPEDLERALASVGLPAILKTRTLGYDGKGQVVLNEGDEPAAAWKRIGGVPAILEGFVPFRREVSLISVRDANGTCRFYPLSENTHRDGILRLSLSRPEDPLQDQAETLARRVLEALDYVGVLAIEFFDLDGRLLANEMAPRVHNSGHWTIEGAVTSQFENHLRAVADLPLGETTPLGHAAMVNLIGAAPPTPDLLRIPGLHLHLYGKAPRPGRKIGHLTLVEETPERLQTRLAQVLERAPEVAW